MIPRAEALREVRWEAIVWGNWRYLAHQSPIHRVFQDQMKQARAKLMMACAVYRALYCCGSCDYYRRQEGK